MSRILCGPGAHGFTVLRVQQALASAHFDPHGADGWYGRYTVDAVRALQQARALPPTGRVDVDTWGTLMSGAPAPSSLERCLQLTAGFEGHGYSLAMGNFDGAWLTWGIIGFTLKHGEVQKIVTNVNTSRPDLVRAAFGEHAEEFLAMLQSPAAEQERWANRVTVGRGLLAEPWRTCFRWFGENEEVQQEQRRRVREDYFAPAVGAAKKLGLTTELGLALCFDVHVQNGGIKPQARAQVQANLAGTATPTELQVREAIARAVAGTARAAYREDVLARKLTIATGTGTVHGAKYVLENWGLGEYAAPELTLSAAARAGQ